MNVIETIAKKIIIYTVSTAPFLCGMYVYYGLT